MCMPLTAPRRVTAAFCAQLLVQIYNKTLECFVGHMHVTVSECMCAVLHTLTSFLQVVMCAHLLTLTCWCAVCSMYSPQHQQHAAA